MKLRSEVPRQTETITFRLYLDEKEAIRKAANRAGKNVAEWIRENLLRKARAA